MEKQPLSSFTSVCLFGKLSLPWYSNLGFGVLAWAAQSFPKATRSQLCWNSPTVVFSLPQAACTGSCHSPWYSKLGLGVPTWTTQSFSKATRSQLLTNHGSRKSVWWKNNQFPLSPVCLFKKLPFSWYSNLGLGAPAWATQSVSKAI